MADMNNEAIKNEEEVVNNEATENEENGNSAVGIAIIVAAGIATAGVGLLAYKLVGKIPAVAKMREEASVARLEKLGYTVVKTEAVLEAANQVANETTNEETK